MERTVEALLAAQTTALQKAEDLNEWYQKRCNWYQKQSEAQTAALRKLAEEMQQQITIACRDGYGGIGTLYVEQWMATVDALSARPTEQG